MIRKTHKIRGPLKFGDKERVKRKMGKRKNEKGTLR
jgi:hypothetical protein